MYATRARESVMLLLSVYKLFHISPCWPILAQAIWEELQDTVHAVDAMTTKTLVEAGL